MTKKCKFCKAKLPVDTKRRKDPYNSEVCDDETKIYMCNPCYIDRVDVNTFKNK